MPMQTEMKRYTPSVNGFNLSRPPAASVPPLGRGNEDREMHVVPEFEGSSLAITIRIRIRQCRGEINF